MCSPTAVMIAISTAVSAYGMYATGRAQARAARQTAAMRDLAAKDAIELGKQEERDFRRRLAAVKGRQKSLIAGSGLDIQEGSPLDILVSTAELGELDALTIRNNAARRAWGLRVSGMDIRNQARISSMQGTYGAAGTLLSGAADTYWAWKHK